MLTFYSNSLSKIGPVKRAALGSSSTKEDPLEATARRWRFFALGEEGGRAIGEILQPVGLVLVEVLVVQTTFESNIGASTTEASSLLEWREKHSTASGEVGERVSIEYARE